MQFRSSRFAVLLLLVPLALSGCGGGGSNNPILPPPTLRFLNGVPDSTRLDFYIDDTLQAGSLNFLAMSVSSNTPAGDHDVTVQETGTITQLDAVAQTFNGNTSYFVTAIGLENFGSEFDKRVRDVFITPNLTVPNGNKSRLIIVQGFNRAVGFATPNVDFKQPGDNVAIDVTNIAFGTSKSIDIDSGTQEFVVQRSGTVQVYIDQTFTFVPGKIYVALIDGMEGGTGTLAPQIQYILVN